MNSKDRKISVLFSVPNFAGGGSQKQTVAIANSLCRKGFKCAVFSLSGGELENEADDKITVLSPCYPSFVKQSGFLSVVWGLFALASAVRREKPDVLYSRHWTKIPNVIIGKILGIKTVWSEGNGARFLRKTNPLLFLEHRLAIGHADLITANSEGLAREIRDVYKLKNAPEIARNGIDTQAIKCKSERKAEHKWFGEQTPVIISVCRLAPQKGMRFLLDAVKIANEKTPVRLLIAGDGKLKEELMNHAKKTGIADKTDFLSQQKNPHRFTAKCDVFVCPSEQEGLSNSLLEAAALAMPIVSTNHQFGADEIIEDGKSGLLVPVRDAKSIADAILKLIENRRLAKQMGEAARKNAVNFSIEKMAENFQALFEKVVQRKKQKILFIVTELGVGGAQKQTVEIANSMVKRGFNAVLLNLAIRDSEDLRNKILPEITVRKARHFKKLSRIKLFSSFASSAYASYAIARAVLEEKADIVYARQWAAKFPAAVAVFLIGMRSGAVFAEVADSEREIERKKISALSKRIVFLTRKLAYKIAGTVVANSSGLACKNSEYFGIGNKTVMIKDGVNAQKIRERAGENAEHQYFSENIPVAVSAGRLDAQKDFATLIKSIAIVAGKTPVRLIIIGGGKLENELKQLAEKLGITENLSFTGVVENPCKYMARCDLFVCSSQFEGMSASLLEAAALAMPIVSTNHQFGADEIIEDGKSGMLVPVGNEKAMAEAVEKILNDRELREKLSVNAKERSQIFSSEKMFSEYEKLFREI